MNLIMFTPATERSAVGRMARLVTRELSAQGHEVVVVRCEDEEFLSEAPHNFGCQLIPWNDPARVRTQIEKADILIYQIGNYYPYHRGCLEWLPEFPGVVCLHDFFLGGLFRGWSIAHREQAKAVTRAWYGRKVARHYFTHLDEVFIENTLADAPMTEWVCSMASGVVTHSSWGIDRVLASCPGPVSVAPLAYDAYGLESHRDETGGAGDDRVEVLTVGFMNANKRVASVIRAIGGSSVLRERVVYHLAGAIESEAALGLSAMAEEWGVDLVIHGAVPDATLASLMGRADIVSCLRWPIVEAASSTAIEAMLWGKPLVVTDAGFYHELPDECVVKVDPSDEIVGVRSALEHLLDDPRSGRVMGAMARGWAERTFTPGNYTAELLTIAASSLTARPVIAAVNHSVDVLRGWGAERAVVSLEDTLEPLRIFDR